ncbi:unnamed protein product, partial [Didymodactylos carnosus]
RRRFNEYYAWLNADLSTVQQINAPFIHRAEYLIHALRIMEATRLNVDIHNIVCIGKMNDSLTNDKNRNYLVFNSMTIINGLWDSTTNTIKFT